MDRATWQIVQFLVCLGLGMGLGLLYDFYRVWFRHGRSRLAIAVGDAVFAFLALMLTFVALLWLNKAEIRFFVILALAFGLFIYLKWLSPHLLPLWQHFFGFCYRAIKAVLRFLGRLLLIILKPIILLSVVLYRMIYFVLRVLGLTGKKMNKGFNKMGKGSKTGAHFLKNKIKNYAGKLIKPKNTKE